MSETSLPPPPPPPARAPRPGWLIGCLILLGVAGLFSIVLLIAAGLFGRFGMTDSRPAFHLGIGRHVGLIELDGEISDATEFLEELRRLEEDARVSALVVRIDSPGGGVAATQEIHHALLRYAEETNRPVVASLGALAASGGYYAACAASRIVAEPGTLTGSIGVIFSFADASELLRKIGVRVDVVKSGEKKDLGAFWRPLSESERAMLQGIVGDVYDQFTEAVAEGRNLPIERVRELADGRIFSGRQAVEVGLADTLGYKADAIRMAATMAGLPPDTPALSRRRIETPFLDLLRELTEKTKVILSATPVLEYR